MNSLIRELLPALITYLPAFVRVSAAMLLLPGLGETAVPATVRIGLSAGITIALSSTLPSTNVGPDLPAVELAAMIVSELLTGIWFGWLTRLIVSALPMAGQYAGYMIGLSNVLQADVDPALQSSALGSLFGLIAPLLFLASGLYMLPLRALAGLFDIIPIGQLLPVADSTEMCVVQVKTLFLLSVQFASPFIIVCVLWHLFIGQMARLGGRMQIYFLSFPGQILVGLLVLILSVEPILLAWQRYAEPALRHLPGNG